MELVGLVVRIQGSYVKEVDFCRKWLCGVCYFWEKGAWALFWMRRFLVVRLAYLGCWEMEGTFLFGNGRVEGASACGCIFFLMLGNSDRLGIV